MKQLLQALTGDTPAAATRCAPSPASACAAPRASRSRVSSYVGSDAAVGRSTIVAEGRLATSLTFHGSTGLMVLPTNARRRPPETPT